jgi:hypothetical protein
LAKRELYKDGRFDHEGACTGSHYTIHSRLGLHRSKHQLLNAGSFELGKEGLQYRHNVAQLEEENRSEPERVTLLDPDFILHDDRIAIVTVAASRSTSSVTFS